jgi:hypothetical protein
MSLLEELDAELQPRQGESPEQHQKRADEVLSNPALQLVLLLTKASPQEREEFLKDLESEGSQPPPPPNQAP